MEDNIKESLRVQIYEDNEELRNMLSMLLTHSVGYEVCGTYSNCVDVINNIAEHHPDVILCDIEMPGVDCIEGVRIIRKHNKKILILMYTVFDDNEHLFEALCEGANGYLLKGESPAEILKALKEMYAGGAPMSPSIAKKVLRLFSIQREKAESDLTPREKEILSLMVAGKSVKMIAGQLDIAFETARTHIKNIYEKLHVHSQTEAVSKAIKERLV
jgi:DNA-binding NarL/FixJ family response regulator